MNLARRFEDLRTKIAEEKINFGCKSIAIINSTQPPSIPSSRKIGRIILPRKLTKEIKFNMKFVKTGKISDSYVIEPDILKDERGLFARTFCKEDFLQINHQKEFVQFNHSMNNAKGTLRGLHYQTMPHREVKLVRCVNGSVFDVIVDLRKDSPTFLHWFGTVLSRLNMHMMYVPEGFAHGFQTLEDDSELIYSHTSYYHPKAEGGIRYNDKMVGVEWPLNIVSVSDKDASYHLIDSNFKGI